MVTNYIRKRLSIQNEKNWSLDRALGNPASQKQRRWLLLHLLLLPVSNFSVITFAVSLSLHSLFCLYIFPSLSLHSLFFDFTFAVLCLYIQRTYILYIHSALSLHSFCSVFTFSLLSLHSLCSVFTFSPLCLYILTPLSLHSHCSVSWCILDSGGGAPIKKLAGAIKNTTSEQKHAPRV